MKDFMDKFNALPAWQKAAAIVAVFVVVGLITGA